jgi:poly-beta-1,6-N-acetyl-D-glucosamine synthase
MTILSFLFWLALAIVFYSYIGYGLLLWVLLKLRAAFTKAKADQPGQDYLPSVTLVVATYNEESIIKKKIENTLALNYPADQLNILFIADGSTDNTVQFIQEYPLIKLLFKPEREGKVAAINRAMQYVQTPYVIFCDANTFLNADCIRNLVKHYTNPLVGAVAGEKKVIDQSEDPTAAGAGEGLYWKYESLLKKLDSAFYTVVGAAGELFSVRTALFEPVATNILLDDFIISMQICRKGYRVVYEPAAFATETPSFSMKEEQKRKIRISAGGFQSIYILRDLLNIFRYGKLSFQYISHRVLRWTLCPVLLIFILAVNLYLFLHPDSSPVYSVLLLLQCIFYGAAIIGWMLSVRNIKIKFLYPAYYFVFMNIALVIGFFRFINKRQTVLWEKAKRKE